jgi:geranylgeranyl diphosphate synthase, type II
MDYKSIIEEKLFAHLLLNIPQTSILYDACKHGLTGGKRIRSSIVLGMSKYHTLSKEEAENAELAAISVEYLHTASLIIDDLPCMDNDLERRGEPSVHAKYGERVAQLASTSLMALAIETLATAVGGLNKKTGLYIIKFVGGRMGASGASGGEIQEFNQSASIKEVIYMKTSTFFEISMILGWLFGNNRTLEECKNVSDAARHIGMAYQIVDDMEDVEQDMKTESRNVNYVIKNGLQESVSQFEIEILEFKRLVPLDARCACLDQLVDLLHKKVAGRIRPEELQ